MGRMQNRLTAKQVEAAQDGWYNDGGNLHLRVGNGGQNKKWVLRYARHGKVTEIGLGGADQVTLKLARKLRDQHLEGLAQGLDPREEKRKQAAARQNRKTFAEAAGELIAARRKNWRTNASDGRTSSLDDWTKHLMVDCKRIANRSVDDIGVDDIKPIVKPVWDSGHTNTARRLLRHIESTLDYAKAHSWRKADNPAAWGVFQHILQAQGPSGPKAHHAALDWPETPAFMAKLRAEAESAMAALALELIILTACRSGEVRGMLWTEINFDVAVWTVPAERMKRKLPHEVPLSADAVALLRRLEAARINKFVFPGRRRTGPVTNYPVWDLVQRLTGRVGEPSMASPHGFRASFRSWCRAKKIRDDVAERCLAHGREDATQAAYDREEMLKDRRRVMERWATFLSGKTGDNVVPIKRGVA
jgi:integrase